MKQVRFGPSPIGKLTRLSSMSMLRPSLGNHNMTIRSLYLPIALGMDMSFLPKCTRRITVPQNKLEQGFLLYTPERSDDFIAYNNAENYHKVYASGSHFLRHIQWPVMFELV